MKILLHICCANCAIYPLKRIKEKGDDAVGYFFNPNIHPYQEYQRRLDALKIYSEKVGWKVIYRDEYPLEEFLRNVSHRVNPVRNFSGALNPSLRGGAPYGADPGIILKSNT